MEKIDYQRNSSGGEQFLEGFTKYFKDMVRLLFLALLLPFVIGSELTFMLDANDEMCFYEHVKQDEETTLEFQVFFYY